MTTKRRKKRKMSRKEVKQTKLKWLNLKRLEARWNRNSWIKWFYRLPPIMSKPSQSQFLQLSSLESDHSTKKKAQLLIVIKPIWTVRRKCQSGIRGIETGNTRQHYSWAVSRWTNRGSRATIMKTELGYNNRVDVLLLSRSEKIRGQIGRGPTTLPRRQSQLNSS